MPDIYIQATLPIFLLSPAPSNCSDEQVKGRLPLHCSHCSLMGDLFSKEQGWRGVSVGRHEEHLRRVQCYCKPLTCASLGHAAVSGQPRPGIA